MTLSFPLNDEFCNFVLGIRSFAFYQTFIHFNIFFSRIFLFYYFLYLLLFALVLPQIVPFDFGSDQINVDDMVMITCAMLKGDTPVDISWSVIDDFGNEKMLSTNEGIVISQSNQRISMLTIEAVQAKHKGEYKCSATNRGGTAVYSAELIING